VLRAALQAGRWYEVQVAFISLNSSGEPLRDFSRRVFPCVTNTATFPQFPLDFFHFFNQW
jgi:hypothetical protein